MTVKREKKKKTKGKKQKQKIDYEYDLLDILGHTEWHLEFISIFYEMDKKTLNCLQSDMQ